MTNSNRDISAIYLLNEDNSLIQRIYKEFGEPLDSYWNGSHTWFDDIDDLRIEYRLHPTSDFEMPQASRPEELFELILENSVDATHYLEGLEVFPVDENNLDIDSFKEYLTSKIEFSPDYIGFVNHDEIGNVFEQQNGKISIIKILIEQIKGN